MVLLWEREPRLVNELGRALELDSGTLFPCSSASKPPTSFCAGGGRQTSASWKLP